ncbi:hypothetical protein MKW92_003429 [Papaver armeniacum]|nr:hypothetical protein MKW92_003429 [Papaver armeniacum]
MVDKGIKLFKIEAPMEGRESLLRSLIKGHANSGNTIVFTDSQTEANQLASVFKCEALKGDNRRDTLLRFQDGEFDLLFASNDVALGIDFPRVELVYIWSRRQIRRSLLLDLVLREIKGLQFLSIL